MRNRCVLARSGIHTSRVGWITSWDYRAIYGGTAPIGAYLAREAVAIQGVGAAVAAAFGMASGVRLANNQSIFAINPILAVCRAADVTGCAASNAVDDDASEDEDYGVRTDEHIGTEN